MAVSQNGWTINPPLAVLTVRGVTFGGANAGDAHVVLEYVAARFDAEVERLIAGTCGCYNPRLIPGSNVWSNHASATAIDCNWQRHPLGARGTFTAAQVRAIRSILAFCGWVIRWGGDFSNVDEMHFEINRNAAAVKALAVKIRNQEDDMPLTEADLDAVEARAKAGFVSAIGDGNAAAKNPDTAEQPKRFIRDALRAIVGGPVDQAAILAAINAHDDVDEAALADALLPGLTTAIVAALPDDLTGLTGADIETAVRNVLRTGVE